MFLILGFEIKSQNAYYDALKLKTYIEDDKFILPKISCKLNLEEPSCQKYVNYISIIKGYLTDELKQKTPNEIVRELRNVESRNYNPFLSDLLDEPTSDSEGINIPIVDKVSGNDMFSKIAGIDVTAITEGLAEFLIERTKDEISIAFIQRFKNQLEKYPELQVLFPQTTDLVKNILAYEYTLILPSLQNAFQDDLEDMFYNFENIFDIPKYRAILIDIEFNGGIQSGLYETLRKFGHQTPR